MTVPELTEKFAELESRIAEEKGPFALSLPIVGT